MKPSDAYMRQWTNYCIIGSNIDLSPGRDQIIWTNAGILLTGAIGTHFSEIVIEIHTFLIQENGF